jgi:outer membrane lipoprotein SlyB
LKSSQHCLFAISVADGRNPIARFCLSVYTVRRIDVAGQTGIAVMRTIVTLFAVAGLTLAASAADAKGCLKGAAVGGVAGHYAGHHGVLGAVAGCIYGRHHAKEQARERRLHQDNGRTNPPDDHGKI